VIRSLVFFFFSSRRRHTRWTGDWSSDVCSSDLGRGARLQVFPLIDTEASTAPVPAYQGPLPASARRDRWRMVAAALLAAAAATEIGRASCRERGEMVAGASRVKKKEVEETIESS